MATLTGITVSPSAIVKGTKATVSVALTNPDRTQKVTGVDENGVPITATYSVHENLSLSVVSAPVTRAPAGQMCFWLDTTTDALSVDPTNPLGLVLQTN